MEKFYDVAIIGGGVIGCLIARELMKFDVSAIILERGTDVASGASKANSGIVHAGHDAACGSLKARFNVEGSRMMARVAEELGVKYRTNGSLVAAFSEEEVPALYDLLERGKKNGVKKLSVISGDKVRELEPNLSKNIVAALHAETGAIICPYGLTIAACGNAMDNGCELRLRFHVTDIKKSGGMFVINDDVRAKIVINAAGLHADDIARMLGDDSIELSPRRGEYMLLDKSCGSFVFSTVFNVPTKMGKGILVTPTVDGNLMLGPTSENIQDKEDVSTGIAGLKKVIDGAKRDAENIPTNAVITSFAGLRAVSKSGDFIIGESSICKNLINVAGIESPGLSASPAIGAYVAGLTAEKLNAKKRKNFIAERMPDDFFRRLGIAEKNRMIEKDKRYGRIICRCEGITEGEIVHAIHTNPCAETIDAVKRRTRSGMGRCQGGFCMPQVAEILAREWGEDILTIEKGDAGSYLNMERTKYSAEERS